MVLIQYFKGTCNASSITVLQDGRKGPAAGSGRHRKCPVRMPCMWSISRTVSLSWYTTPFKMSRPWKTGRVTSIWSSSKSNSAPSHRKWMGLNCCAICTSNYLLPQRNAVTIDWGKSAIPGWGWKIQLTLSNINDFLWALQLKNFWNQVMTTV